MTSSQTPIPRWQIWVIAHGDYLRTPAGAVRLFTSVDEAKRAAQEIGGIVQIEGAPPLGGFDRALS
jgi:hypothetical protein